MDVRKKQASATSGAFKGDRCRDMVLTLEDAKRCIQGHPFAQDLAIRSRRPRPASVYTQQGTECPTRLSALLGWPFVFLSTTVLDTKGVIFLSTHKYNVELITRGMLTALLDEAFSYMYSVAFPGSRPDTASLKVNFGAMCHAGSFLSVTVRLEEKVAGQAYISGELWRLGVAEEHDLVARGSAILQDHDKQTHH